MHLKVIGTLENKGPYEHLLKDLAAGKDVVYTYLGTEMGTSARDSLLAKEYSSALVTVLPSVYRDVYGHTSWSSELLGLVLLESMACGTPVICTQVGGMPELVKDGETGFVVPPNDPVSIREKITLLQSHPDLAREMGERGRELVRKDFTWDRTAERCIHAYARHHPANLVR